MYARSNTMQGDPGSIDRMTAYTRDDVMNEVRGLQGNVGISMLADRTTGRCIVTTSWESEEAMHASESGVHESRQKAAGIMGATPQVEEWEVALVHRAHEGHDGARTRVIRSDVEPSGMDRMLEEFRSDLVARVDSLPGFCSVSLLVDRQRGRCAMSATYEDQAAMEAAAERTADMRRELSERMGMRITDVAEYDLVLHHLRVPELV